MAEPRIVSTNITRTSSEPAAAPPAATSSPGTGTSARSVSEPGRGSLPVEPEIHPLLQDEPRVQPVRVRRGMSPAWWGLLLAAGGLAVWGSIQREDPGVPDVWKETTGPEGPVAQLESRIRPAGPAQGQLLRLEWPEHPSAESYLVEFLDERGVGPAPVPVQSTVFLYDMQTNVLHLPSQFDWVVTAILPDGSNVVTPSRRYPE